MKTCKHKSGLFASRRGERSLSGMVATAVLVIVLGAMRMYMRSQNNSSTRTDIVGIRADDPLMKKATHDARERWSEFATAYMNKADDNDSFGVKTGFATRSGRAESEHMWVSVSSLNGNMISGVLVDDPELDVGLAMGDKVEFKVSEIDDWVYTDKDGTDHGNFSEAAMEKAQKRRRR